MSKPVCVVVGVGPGTGAAMARRFAAEGHAIALVASFAVVALARRAPDAARTPVRTPATTLEPLIDAGVAVIASDAAPVTPLEPAQGIAVPAQVVADPAPRIAAPTPPAVVKPSVSTVRSAAVRKKPAPIAPPAEATKPAPVDVGASRE